MIIHLPMEMFLLQLWGHSSDEVDVKLPNGQIKTLQQAIEHGYLGGGGIPEGYTEVNTNEFDEDVYKYEDPLRLNPSSSNDQIAASQDTCGDGLDLYRCPANVAKSCIDIYKFCSGSCIYFKYNVTCKKAAVLLKIVSP